MIRSGIPGKTGRTRLKGEALKAVRIGCFLRAKNRCEECGRKITWGTFEMAHIQSRGAGGSDVESNVRALCPSCHRREHCPKSVPTKTGPA